MPSTAIPIRAPTLQESLGDATEQEQPESVASINDKIWRWAKRQAIGQMSLSWGARECWRLLDAFPSGKCYPSHYFIAQRLRKSPSAARRYLGELRRHDYIEITIRFDSSRGKRAPRGQVSNAYSMRDQPDLIARATQIAQEWAARHRKERE